MDRLTVEAARHAIVSARIAGRLDGALDRPSRLNRALTHREALDILEAGIAGFAAADVLEDSEGVRRGLIGKNIRKELRLL